MTIMRGTISKRGDKYLPRFRGPDGREVSKAFSRKADAQRWLDQQTAAVVRGEFVDPTAGRVTFAAFYAEWRERQVWAPRTVEAMDLAASSVPFTAVSLGALRRSHIESWIKAMTARGLAASTVHTRVQNVRAVLRGAVVDRLIGRDPSEGVALPRRRRTEAAMRVPTPSEVGALLGAAAGPFRAFLGLSAFAGLRLGETAAVQVADVDFLRRTLRVTRQVQRAGGGEVDVRPPKHGSERTVFLAPSLVDLLSAHVARHCPDGGWLFPTVAGGPVTANTIGPQWRRTLARAEVSGVRLHDLRHFYASGLIASGCDVVTVQRALGHASATTTLSTYSHLWPTAEDRTRSAAEAMLAEASAARGLGADSATPVGL
nr:Phage integrase [uncultured bacterium]